MEEKLRKLIEFPTVTGDESNDAALGYVADFLRKKGMHVKRYRSNGFGSLVATTQTDSKRPKVMLAAHLDVVPAPEKLFQLRKKDGKYLGRGVFDMKFALAAYMQAVDSLQDKLDSMDFGIMVTTDEEVGGNEGVRYLIDRGYSAEICLLPDGADGWHVEASAKGVYILTVTANGKTAHGSRPWEGDSAIEKVLKFLEAAQSHVPPVKKHTDTTMVVTQLHGGEARNQIPAHASAMIDIRFLQDETLTSLRHKLRTLGKAYEVKITTEMIARATVHDTDLPLVEAWEEAVRTVRGKTPDNYALSFGSSDARFLVDAGVPTIVTRPDGGGAHGDAEWIDAAGVEDFYTCVTEYLVKVATTTTPVDESDRVRYNVTKLPKTATGKSKD